MWLAGTLLYGGGLLFTFSLPPAIVLAKLLASTVSFWDPLYNARVLDPTVLARGIVVVLLASLVGSLIPLRALWRLDAAVVFQR